MPDNKVVTYTIKIDSERYKSLPFMAYGGNGFPVGSFETTADILLQTLGIPQEILSTNSLSWREGNHTAIMGWLNSLQFIGDFSLFSQDQKQSDGTVVVVKSKINGVP